MVQVNGTSITITRGDTARLSVFITDAEGESYTPSSQDTIRFAMKKDFKEGDETAEEVLSMLEAAL